MQTLQITDFLNLQGRILDVRSPGEYKQGRIPEALNLPLFSDEERAVVGTLYKHSGKSQAIEQGLRFVGPKLADFVSISKTSIAEGPAKIYCWRGGMRSASMAWLLQLAGIKTLVLEGGYKTYRRRVLQILSQPRKLAVIGGFTGSGKTSILHELKRCGEQILNLEQLACHKGSSYGMLGMPMQPSTEQFENEIASVWSAADPNRILWIEDENHMIGRCKIPDPIYNLMLTEPLIFIECSLEERIEKLVKDYGSVAPEDLIMATKRIARRLGGARTAEIINLIQSGHLWQAIELSLHYYDATYQYGLSRRTQKTIKIQGNNLSYSEWAEKLIVEVKSQ